MLKKPHIGLLDQVLDRTLLPGVLGFTRVGYALRTWCSEDIPDSLRGRRIVLTGATSGLGLAAAHTLASLDASLVLIGRDADKLQATCEAIVARHGVASPQAEVADLALMSEVRALATRLRADPQPIHVLINNAGALFGTRELTAEGHERSLAINLLAPFLLTELLLPKLADSAPARVVNVASGGMYAQSLQLDDLQYERGEYDGARAYARAKRGLVAMTEHLAADERARGVVLHSMHPGWADTPGVRSSLPTFFKVTRPLLRDADQGADTIVWLAAAATPSRSSGGFWLDRHAHPTAVLPGTRVTAAQREALQDRLRALVGLDDRPPPPHRTPASA